MGLLRCDSFSHSLTDNYNLKLIMQVMTVIVLLSYKNLGFIPDSRLISPNSRVCLSLLDLVSFGHALVEQENRNCSALLIEAIRFIINKSSKVIMIIVLFMVDNHEQDDYHYIFNDFSWSSLLLHLNIHKRPQIL